MYYYLFEPQRGPKDFERTAQLKELLSSLGIAGEMASPTPGKTIEDLVEMAVAKRYSTIVAVGGIELVNKVAHALCTHEAVFGIIPTAEHPDLTRLIGVSDWKSAAEQLKRRRVQLVRLGSLNDQITFLTPAHVQVPIESGFSLDTASFTLKGQGGTIEISPVAADELPILQIEVQAQAARKPGFLSKLLNRSSTTPTQTRLALDSFRLETGIALPITLAGSTVAHTPATFTARDKALRLIVGKGNST